MRLQPIRKKLIAERFELNLKDHLGFSSKSSTSNDQYPLERDVYMDEFEITPQKGEQSRSKSDKKNESSGLFLQHKDNTAINIQKQI